MNAPDDHAALSLLEKLREALSAEVVELEHELEGAGGEVEAQGAKLEAKLRMLSLVEATEQHLGDQHAGLHEGGPVDVSVDASAEVRA
jgi:vacuolar-type H+-ATPase subunit D/Vma8